MINIIRKAIPAKSIGYMLICGGIVLVIVLGLISFHRYNFIKEQKVQKLQNQIDEQKALGPIYFLMIKELQKKEDFIFPNPETSKLSRQDTDKFTDAIKVIAGKSGIMTVSVLPDVKTIDSSSPYLLFNATFKGELTNFRKFIIKMGTISYVDHIEEMSIKQYSDSMGFKLKIWIVPAN